QILRQPGAVRAGFGGHAEPEYHGGRRRQRAEPPRQGHEFEGLGHGALAGEPGRRTRAISLKARDVPGSAAPITARMLTGHPVNFIGHEAPTCLRNTSGSATIADAPPAARPGRQPTDWLLRFRAPHG